MGLWEWSLGKTFAGIVCSFVALWSVVLHRNKIVFRNGRCRVAFARDYYFAGVRIC